MTTKELIHLYRNPKALQKEHTDALMDIIRMFPYFQSARCLLLKGLKDQHSFLYNQELKKTAAYTTDRGILFEFITQKITSNTLQNDTSKHSEEIGTIAHSKTSDINSIDIETSNTSEVILQPNAPLDFNTKEVYSFSEWLKITTLKPIDRSQNKTKKTDISKPNIKQLQQSELIDEFISKNPKIPPVTKGLPSRNLAKEQKVVTDELMTETLAKVYLAQKKYKKAIQAYHILILKNPEKSGFFADHIRAIEQLKDQK